MLIILYYSRVNIILYKFTIIRVGILIRVVGPCFARVILLDFSEKLLGPSKLLAPLMRTSRLGSSRRGRE